MSHGDYAVSFDTEDLQRLNQLLQGLLVEASARSAFLVDRAGQLLTSEGATSGVDHASFASLAAADFAASDQLAELLGEDEFASLYHQGDVSSMVLVDVGGRAILAALFDSRTTLGMVRLKTKTLIPELVRLFEAAAQRERSEPRPTFGANWADEASGEIDRLFTE